MRQEEKITLKAISMCFRPYLKPEEAYIYTNLERTQFLKKCNDFGIYKNAAGYYNREHLDRMMSGGDPIVSDQVKKLKL